jgi:hypothetical protein
MVTSPQVSWLFFKARATIISKSIREERVTPKNSQLAAALRVAMKMGRRPRCSSVTYRSRILEKQNSLQMSQVFSLACFGAQMGLAFQGFKSKNQTLPVVREDCRNF